MKIVVYDDNDRPVRTIDQQELDQWDLHLPLDRLALLEEIADAIPFDEDDKDDA